MGRNRGRFLVLLATLAYLFIFKTALATVTVSVTDLTISNQGILPNSGDTAILRVNVSATGYGTPIPTYNEEVNSIKVTFYDENPDYPFDATKHISSVELYKTRSTYYGGGTLIASQTPTGNTVEFSGLNLLVGPPTDYFYIVIRTTGPDKITGTRYSNADTRTKFSAKITQVAYDGYIGALLTPQFSYPNVGTNVITCEAGITDLVPVRGIYDNEGSFLSFYPGIMNPDVWMFAPEYNYMHGELENYRAGNQDHGWGGRPDAYELMGMNHPYRVFGLHLAGRSTYTAHDDNEYLTSVKVTFEDTGVEENFNPAILASHPLAPYPNVSLWRDVDRDGAFNPNVDTLIVASNIKPGTPHIEIAGSGPWTATLEYSDWQFPIDKTVESTYFLVIATKPDHGWVTDTPYYGADFSVYIDVPGDVTVERRFGVDPGTLFSNDFITLYKDKLKDVHMIFDLKPFSTDPPEADGVPVSIFSFNMCDSRETYVNDALEWIRVWFKGTGGFKPNHLMPLADGPDSGVSLWMDNKSSGSLGVPDSRTISSLDMLQGRHRLSIDDTYVPLSADSLEWYNSDGTKWSPDNDDPQNIDNDDKRYFVVIKPKTPLAMYPDDYIEDPIDTQYKGFDYFICVKARGVSVPETGYKDAVDKLKRGIDYGISVNAAVGLTKNNDILSIINDDPWEDILFSSGFKARIFPSDAGVPQPIKVTTSASTVSTVPAFFTNLTEQGQTVSPFEKKAVVGINLVAPSDVFSFDRFAFILIDEGLENLDFAEIVAPTGDYNNPDSGCGIALYCDDGDIPGVFDPADNRVWMTERPEVQRNLNDPVNWRRVILHLGTNPVNVTSPIHSAATVPETDTGDNIGPDYFLVIQPNQNMEAGDDFSIMLWGSDILPEMDDTIHFTDIGGTGEKGITYKRLKTYTLTNTTVTTAVGDSIPEGGMKVDAESDMFEAIGINVYDASGDNNLLGARVYFNPVTTQLTPNSVLAPIANNETSGLSLWMDTNGNGRFDAEDTFVSMAVTSWRSDYTEGFVAGPDPRTVLDSGQILSSFDHNDNVYWLDWDGDGKWSDFDTLWIDNSTPENGIYNNGVDTLIAGIGWDDYYGVELHGYQYGFAYYDINSDGSYTYDDKDDIYFLGKGRDTLGYFIDLSFDQPFPLPTATSDESNFFIVFRTGSDIKWQDSFSLSLPSNALLYTSGTSFANRNITTNTIEARIPVLLTDFVESGDIVLREEQKSVIGIQLYDNNGTDNNFVSEINIYIEGTNPFGDLAQLSTGTQSGVMLYEDNNLDGMWQSTDTTKFPDSISWLGGNRVRMIFNNSQVPVPDNPGVHYFIVLKTSANATIGNQLRVTIRSSLSTPMGEGIKFSDAGSSEKYITGTYFSITSPVMEIVPLSLDFGIVDSTRTFTVSNTGGGILIWEIGTPAYHQGSGWITDISPYNGTLPGGSSRTLTVTVDRGALTTGIYTASIPVNSTDVGSKMVDVTIRVEGPTISVAPQTLNFTGSEATKIVYVRNIGEGTLNWQVGTPVYNKGTDWITGISPVVGTTTTEEDSISFTVSRQGLPQETYTASVEITSDGGSALISISMDVEGPSMSISPTTINFGGILTGSGFEIINEGAEDLNWSIDINDIEYTQLLSSGWITDVSPLTDPATTMGSPSEVSITVSREGLPEGTYSAKIYIKDNINVVTQFVSVVLSVETEKVLKAAAGAFHTAVIKSDGSLWAWGRNDSGQVGDGTTENKTLPVRIGTDTDWTEVSAGYAHTVGIKNDGTLWAWGKNNAGQLGDGTTTDRSVPVQIGTDTKWSAVACGSYHTLALKTDGSLWVWGLNDRGQLGIGNYDYKYAPVRIDWGNSWVSISGGWNHSLALKSNGTLWAWGSNEFGQLGIGSYVDRNIPIMVTGDYNWSKISTGWYHSLAIKADGTLYTWGLNDSGQLGDGTIESRTAPAYTGNNFNTIAAGSMHSVGVKADSTLWTWGSNSFGQLGLGNTEDKWIPTQVGTENTWVGVVTGASHAIAALSNGTLWAWGSNGFGQLGDGTTSSRFSPYNIGAGGDWTGTKSGGFHSVALKEDGSLWVWGSNQSGQLGNGTTEDVKSPSMLGTDTDWDDVSAGEKHTVAIKKDGTLWAWGNNDYGQLGDNSTIERNTPVQIGYDDNWEGVSAGYRHTVAIKKDGTLWAWGNNSSGQLGNGTTINSRIPLQVGLSDDWADVSAGESHTVAIKNDGTLWAWGGNSTGQLGDGTYIGAFTPKKIGFDTTWEKVSAGYRHTAGIKTGGTLWVWGSNWYGQLGTGTSTDANYPVMLSGTLWYDVSAGFSHTVAVRQDGTLWAWGSNWYGQLGIETTGDSTIPVRISTEMGWETISAGYSHTTGIKSIGTLWAWGSELSGETAIGSDTAQPESVGGNAIMDINSDEEINISDVILCLRMAIGIDEVSTSSIKGDVNWSGSVDISDVILLLRRSIGIE
jgi:alpha-tubulin suppressor-like RCC1 family protein